MKIITETYSYLNDECKSYIHMHFYILDKCLFLQSVNGVEFDNK